MRRAVLLLPLLAVACTGEPAPVPLAAQAPPTVTAPAPSAPVELYIPERFIQRPKRKPSHVAHPPADWETRPASAPPGPSKRTPVPVVQAPTPPPVIAVTPPVVPPEPRLESAPVPAPAPLPATTIPDMPDPDPMLVPAPARPYQRTMIRESRAVWGITAPTALFGAQIQTESAWRPGAHSIYAAGLSQFIPSTAEEMSQKYPELGDGGPLNPQWAIRALVRYDHDIYRGRFVNAVTPASECDKWAFVLSGYNGGEGWISRDRAQCQQHAGCDPSRWYGHVERYTTRSASNAQQNREYMKRIELQYQGLYRSWSPSGFIACRA